MGPTTPYPTRNKWVNLVISKSVLIAGVWFGIALPFTELAWRSDRFHFSVQLMLERLSHLLIYAALFVIVILFIDGLIHWRTSRKSASASNQTFTFSAIDPLRAQVGSGNAAKIASSSGNKVGMTFVTAL